MQTNLPHQEDDATPNIPDFLHKHQFEFCGLVDDAMLYKRLVLGERLIYQFLFLTGNRLDAYDGDASARWMLLNKLFSCTTDELSKAMELLSK